MKTALRLAIQNLALALAYFVTAELGLMLDAVEGFATLVWAPSGISLACLLIFGRHLWPGVSLGALSANLAVGAPLLVAAGIACGNTLEAIVAVYLLRRLPGFDRSLERVRDVLGFLALGGLLSPAVAASIGVSSLWLGGVVSSAALTKAWWAWWLGDLIGILVIAPLLLTWSRSHLRLARTRTKWMLELVALGGAVAAISWVVFGWELFGAYLLFAASIWAALRFYQRGVATSTFVLSGLAITGTVLEQGPFVRDTLVTSLFALQAFMAVTASTFLVLGAVVAERFHLVRELRLNQREIERKVAERTAALERAEDAAFARDEFLAIAAHELRTPLSALTLQLDSLRRALQLNGGELPNHKIPGKLDKAMRATNRLSALVNNLLDVSRIAAGKLELQRAECDLASVAHDLFERMSEPLARAGCELRCRVDKPIPGVWDRIRVEQILENLLSNAMKYGAGKPIEVDVAATDESVIIEVRDHGIGIQQADLERVFDRFERAVPANHYGGLGLGLYITRQIVKSHDGGIEVTSEPGAGARFVVTLPRKQAAMGATCASGTAGVHPIY